MKSHRKFVLRSLLAILIISALAFEMSAQRRRGQARRPADKVIATKTIRGELTGLESGDYLNAVIAKPGGKKQSFYIRPPGMEYFLALHKGEPLDLTYQVVDTFIPEAGGVERVEQLIAAKAGSLTYASWWREVRRRFTTEQLDKKYGGLIEKSTIRQ